MDLTLLSLSVKVFRFESFFFFSFTNWESRREFVSSYCVSTALLQNAALSFEVCTLFSEWAFRVTAVSHGHEKFMHFTALIKWWGSKEADLLSWWVSFVDIR